jgi:hypothetical protein
VPAQDEGIRASAGWLPAEALQDEIVAALREDPRFRLESERADRDGRRMYLFSRHGIADATTGERRLDPPVELRNRSCSRPGIAPQCELAAGSRCRPRKKPQAFAIWERTRSEQRAPARTSDARAIGRVIIRT